MGPTTKVPEKGFYYHFKHDLLGSLENYAYEVMGVARHSEDGSYLVIYRPLYKNTYPDAADYSARPLEMFMEEVARDGKTFSRFKKITDAVVIAQLEIIKDNMYG